MTPQQILEEVNSNYSEHLEMMTTEEQLILIKNILAQKLAWEIAQKDFYKTCFDKSFNSNYRLNS